jgi:hypothetical protein
VVCHSKIFAMCHPELDSGSRGGEKVTGFQPTLELFIIVYTITTKDENVQVFIVYFRRNDNIKLIVKRIQIHYTRRRSSDDVLDARSIRKRQNGKTLFF